MVEIINENDISKYQKYLKLKPNYTASELENNFKKASKAYHPSVRRDQGNIFDIYVIGYEVLLFMLKNKKKNITLNSLIRIWNNEERQKVETKLIEYKSLSLNEYTKKIENKSTTFRIMQLLVLSVFFIVFAIVSLFMLETEVYVNVSLIAFIAISINLFFIAKLLFKSENKKLKLKNPFQDLY